MPGCGILVLSMFMPCGGIEGDGIPGCCWKDPGCEYLGIFVGPFWGPADGCPSGLGFEEGLEFCHCWGDSGVPEPLIDGDCGVLGPIGLPTCDVGVMAECGDILAL